MRWFTANNAAQQSLFVCANASEILETPPDGWLVIAPYGEHPSPDGSYVQVFQRAQAERMVSTWNSLTGRAARWLNNARHLRLTSMAAPVWEGHPDVDAKRWPNKLLLADVSDLRAGETGLEGFTTWNAANMAQRGPGPLTPSSYWVHDAPDAEGRVYPELLLSVGLTPTPNIKTAPAWTRNSTAQTHIEMQQKDIALALGLAADASWEQIKAAISGSTANAAAVTTANAAATNAQSLLATANQQLGIVTADRDAFKATNVTLTTANATLTTERDTLKTEKATLTTERDGLKATANALGESLALLGEKAGRFTPAKREEWKGKLSLTTANSTPATVEAAAKELVGLAPVLNTASVGALNTPAGLATANAAADAFEGKVREVMRAQKLGWNEAWESAEKDPANATLLEAMKQPSA